MLVPLLDRQLGSEQSSHFMWLHKSPLHLMSPLLSVPHSALLFVSSHSWHFHDPSGIDCVWLGGGISSSGSELKPSCDLYIQQSGPSTKTQNLLDAVLHGNTRVTSCGFQRTSRCRLPGRSRELAYTRKSQRNEDTELRRIAWGLEMREEYGTWVSGSRLKMRLAN